MEQIQCELKADDFVWCMKTMINKSPRWRRTRIILSICAAIFLLAILENPANVIQWVWLCLSLAYIFYPNAIWPIIAKKNYQKQKQIHGLTTISFDDSSISFKTKAGESTRRWISGFTVTPDILIIYPNYTRLTAHFILKKFCRDEDQFNRIVRLAQKLKEFEI